MALRKYFECREAYYQQRLVRIEIYDTQYVGDAEEGRLSEPAFNFKYDADDETLECPIRGSSVDINVYEEEEEEYEFTYITDAKRCEVLFKFDGEDGEVFWHGFIQPELYEGPDTSVPREVTLVAVDGLALLKDKYYETHSEDFVSLLYLIRKALLEITLTNNATYIYDFMKIYENNMSDVSVNSSPLAQLYLNDYAFKSDDEDDETFMSYYDMLENILKRFHLFIRVHKDGFVIMQINSQKSESIQGRKMFTSGQDYSLVTWESINLVQRLNSDSSRNFWLDGSQYQMTEPGWKSFTINQDYLLVDNMIESYSFVEVKGTAELVTTAGVDEDQYVQIHSAVWENKKKCPASDYILFKLADIIEDDDYFGVSISIEDSYTGETGQAKLMLCLVGDDDTYYMKPSGKWTTSRKYFYTLDSSSDETPTTSFDSAVGFPTTGELQLRIYLYVEWDETEYNEYLEGNGEPITYQFDFINSSVTFNYYLGLYETEEVTTSLNENNNSEESIDVILGDLPVDYYQKQIYYGGLYIYKDGEYVGTSSWTLLDAGDDATLNELVGDLYGGNHLYPLKKIEGNISGDISLNDPFEEPGGKRFQLLTASVDNHLCEWDVVMMEITEAYTDKEESFIELQEETSAGETAYIETHEDDDAYLGTQQE